MSRDNQASADQALREYLGDRGLQRRVQQAAVVNEWPALVGARLAKVTTPVSVDAGGTLWVRVHSHSWMQELHMMSREIARELAAGGKPIKNIRWLAADAPVPTSAPRPDRRSSGRRPTT